MHHWLTNKLIYGDLTALRDLAHGGAKPNDQQIKRLTDRGFMKCRADGAAVVTPLGHLALFIRKITQ